MPLWGNKDSKTATGTVIITSAGAVSGNSTLFATQAVAGNFLRIAGEDYRITTVTSNTAITVVAGNHGATLTAVSSNTAYTLSEKPIYVSTAEAVGGVAGDMTKIFGVDATETTVGTTKVQHAGWVRRVAGTGGRLGRTEVETLVAMGSISGDQADDTQFADS